jgi:uncharacterized protein (TIGR03067 family)
MRPYAPLLIGVVLLSVADASGGDAAKEELKKLQGTWKVVEMEAAGKPLLEGKKTLPLVIEGEKLTIMDNTMGMKIDPTPRPRLLDLLLAKGEERLTLKCIYALDKDELKICMPLLPKKGQKDVDPAKVNQRPKSFETAGKPLVLITAKREKR